MATLTCPTCRTPFQQGDLICLTCGANLARVRGAARADEAVPPVSPPPPQTPPQQPQQPQPQQPQPIPSAATPQGPPFGQPVAPPQQQFPPLQPPAGQPYPPQPQDPYAPAGPQGAPQQPPYEPQQPAAPPQSYDQPSSPYEQPGAPYDHSAPPQYGQQPAPYGQQQAPYEPPPLHYEQPGQPPAQYEPPASQPYGGQQGFGQPPPYEPTYDPPGPGTPPYGPQPFGAGPGYGPQDPPPRVGPPMPPRPAREETLLPPEGGAHRSPPAAESTAAMCPYCETVLTNPAAAQCDNCLRPLAQQPPMQPMQPPTAGPPVLRLQFPTGELQLQLGQHLVLGRDAGQSPVAGTFTQYDNVSRRHTTVWLDQSGTAWCRDERSTNGTFVNGERLPAGVEAPLKDGDSLRLAADVTGTVRIG